MCKNSQFFSEGQQRWHPDVLGLQPDRAAGGAMPVPPAAGQEVKKPRFPTQKWDLFLLNFKFILGLAQSRTAAPSASPARWSGSSASRDSAGDSNRYFL